MPLILMTRALTSAMYFAIRIEARIALPWATRPPPALRWLRPMMPMPTGLPYSSSSCRKMSEQAPSPGRAA